MRYLLKRKEIRKKYESEVEKILENESYRIQKIESFAEFSDPLNPFRECAILLNTSVSPISFSECENRCKVLGVDVLTHHKMKYDEAKYEWVKKHCTNETISFEENLEMLMKIQESTIPFGAFTIAFKCHRLHDKTIKSHYSDKQIPFAPLLYDMVDVEENVSEFFCNKLAEKIQDNTNPFYQMNVYTDNILTIKDIDSIYPLIRKLAHKYNEYTTTVYHNCKDSEIYRHREDFLC